MTKTFNFQRFGRLVKWSLANDSAYNRKQALILLVVPSLYGIFVNLLPDGHDSGSDIKMMTAVFVAMLLTTVATGGCYMFTSFKDRKDAMRELIMLPASNLEKFVVRYLTSFLFMALASLVSVAVADVLQYAVGLLLHRTGAEFVMPRVMEITMSALTTPAVITLFFWSHTFFMLGANFFRNVKYSWVLTAFVILIIVIAVTAIVPHTLLQLAGDTMRQRESVVQVSDTLAALTLTAVAMLSVGNVRLAYHLFCRRQLIGKYFNY
ncbi:MAG: hypothetical protein II612_03910 [Prevotella sp.]|nr:hypothetical protein [Prevotella sp.]